MKKFCILFFLVLLSATAFSQIEVEDSSAYASVEAYRDDVFRMDLQQVPSGILLEYSLFPFDTANYDGLANDDDILNDKGDIFGLLEVLRTGTVSDTAIIPSPDSLFAEAYLHRHNTGNIPLTFYTNRSAPAESSISISPLAAKQAQPLRDYKDMHCYTTMLPAR